MDKKRKRLIKRIYQDINDILIEDRIWIANEISMRIEKESLFFEGMGCKIRFADLNDYLLTYIDEFIQEAKKKTCINLD